MQPLLDIARDHDRGVFVLAATSNPEGASVQRRTARGRTVAQSIVDDAAAANGAGRPGSVGVVVGATLTDPPDVSALNGPVLVPGVGAQGGRPETLAGLGGALPGQLLPAVSREVLRAGPDVGALRGAAERMRDAVAYLRTGRSSPDDAGRSVKLHRRGPFGELAALVVSARRARRGLVAGIRRHPHEPRRRR